MRLYEMTPTQIRAEIELAKTNGDDQRALFLEEQLGLLYRIGEAWRARGQHG